MSIERTRREEFVKWAGLDGGHCAWDDVLDFLCDSGQRELAEALRYGVYTDMRSAKPEELAEFPSGGVPTGALRINK